MVIYGISLSVLENQMKGEYPIFIQFWYSDEFSTEGTEAHLKIAIDHIEVMGPARGSFIEPKIPHFVKDLGS